LGAGCVAFLSEEAARAAKTETRRLLLVWSVVQQVLYFRGEFFKRSRKIDLVSCGNNRDHSPQVGRAGTRTQRAIEQRFRPIDDNLRRIKVVLAAQAVAFRASAVNAVEGKRAWLERGDVDAAIGAGHAG